MQLNATAALMTAVIAAGIGFGLAFYIERKISSRMQRKSQRTLVFIAMTSFGYGLMATLNEVIGFPLQGLEIRYVKLAGFVLANMLFFPIILLAIAKLIGLKIKAIGVDLGVQPKPVVGNSFKYFLILAGVLSVAYFGYAAVERSASDATYDFYSRVDEKNCSSPLKDKPDFSLKFSFKKETNEIFMTTESNDAGVKEQQIHKLNNCSVLDSKNWTCGGNRSDGGYRFSTYMFIDGAFAFERGFFWPPGDCDGKFVKR